MKADQVEYAQLRILGVLVTRLTQVEDFRVLLPDQFVKHASLECVDDASSIRFMVEVAARRLGEDTGRDVLFDVGSQLTKIYEGWKKIVQVPKGAV
jgi:hypothetical protein